MHLILRGLLTCVITGGWLTAARAEATSVSRFATGAAASPEKSTENHPLKYVPSDSGLVISQSLVPQVLGTAPMALLTGQQSVSKKLLYLRPMFGAQSFFPENRWRSRRRPSSKNGQS